MNPRHIITYMLNESGNSRSGISVKMGRSRNFLNSTIFNKSTPRVDTVVAVADLCGFDVVIVPHGSELPKEAIKVDPME